MSDELWQQLGGEKLIQQNMWPVWDDKLITSDTMTIVVQVNGKMRAKFDAAIGTSEDEIKKTAIENDNVKNFVGDKTPLKIIYVPGKIVNIVIGSWASAYISL